LEDVPDVALAATSNISSVVCPDAGCVFGDTTGDVFDAVPEVALGVCVACRRFLSCLVRTQVHLLRCISMYGLHLRVQREM